MDNKFLRNKKVLITGATGSIGSSLLENIIGHRPRRVTVFSRDEYKQHRLRYKYDHMPNLNYILGDVRDLESVMQATKDTDIIFHSAALKHVPVSEEMPEEFIKTNILGSLNVKKAAIAQGVKALISISTDKAVDPLNVMGLTKAIQEKIFSSHILQKKLSETRFVNVRFGNVIGTTGSLFPIIYHQILNKKPLTVTSLEMTRFFMTKEEAIELVLWAARYGKDGEVVMKKMKSTNLRDLINLFLKTLQMKKSYPVKQVGIRVGEKMHEALITQDEFFRTKQRKDFYIISPYSHQAIKKNIIPKSLLKKRNGLDVFYSQTPTNFFKEKELKSHIANFVKHTQGNLEII